MKRISAHLALVTALGLLPIQAGTITSQGSVVALTDIQSLVGTIGTATFDEGPIFEYVPLDRYVPAGMLFHAGEVFTDIIPGIAQSGLSYRPYMVDTSPFGVQFLDPVAGGGTASGLFGVDAGVATFSQRVTQFGLTAGRNGVQYITAWDRAGNLIGQVKWEPADDAAFVGIDTLGVEIGLLTYGNDDIYGGESYDVGGSAIFSDDWRWASGPSVIPEGQPAALLAGSVLVGWLAMRRSRRPSAA